MPSPVPRPAPLVLVATGDGGSVDAVDATFGTYTALAAAGQRLLAAELSQRLGRRGAAVRPLPRRERPAGEPFHWGSWFAPAAREALADASRSVDALGYAGAGALALLGDDDLDALVSPPAGEAVANNRFSTDAFVVAGDSAALRRALDALADSPTDNGAARHLEEAGFAVRDLASRPWSRFDVDTPLDLALLRLATRLPGARPLDGLLRSWLEMARLPGDEALEVPQLARIGEVIRNRGAELVVAGRVPAAAWAYLEAQTACRVRCFIEERGMRAAHGGRPRSLLAAVLRRGTPSDLVTELGALGDAVILDTRVLMASLAGSSEAEHWPPEEERFASDFGRAEPIATPWLRELVVAASESRVPFLFGGHALVSDGLRLLVDAAWLGR